MRQCRLCDSRILRPILDLGHMPLANAFLESPDEPEEYYPLELVFCEECSLVQITETVPPAKLFSHYLYFSSQSQTMVEHARQLAERLICERKLDKDSLVLEIASNDGYLLQHFRDKGIPILGVEPAKNIAAVANAKGITTHSVFFDSIVGGELPKADVVIGLNVLGHVSALNDFVRGIRWVLKPNGVAVIEVPYVRDMVENVEVDTIYHEHLCYFSLCALYRLFGRHNLIVQKAERIPIHGGSIRIFVCHQKHRDDHSVASSDLTNEVRQGMDRWEYYKCFGERAYEKKNELHDFIYQAKGVGAKIIGYGAAAKGTMLLNYCKIGVDAIDYVVDSTPAKQGKFVPGVRIPIVPPERFGNPDYVLLTAWNFKEEIKAKHPDFKGGWIVPGQKVSIE